MGEGKKWQKITKVANTNIKEKERKAKKEIEGECNVNSLQRSSVLDWKEKALDRKKWQEVIKECMNTEISNCNINIVALGFQGTEINYYRSTFGLYFFVRRNLRIEF